MTVTSGAQQGAGGAQMGEEAADRAPVAVGVSGVNGATAIGARSRFSDRRSVDSSR